MKKIFAIISLAALMMPVSCVKEDFAGSDAIKTPTVGMTFTALMENPGTKTSLVIDENTGKGNVSWTLGDKIKFDYEIGKVDSEPVTSDALEVINEGVATFSVELPAEFALTEAEYKETLEEGATNSRHLYVAYPASLETEYASSAYHVTIPAVQDGLFENASIALAKWNPFKPNDPLQFKNLCGLLQVVIEDENVRTIKLTSSSDIAGQMNIGFTESSDANPLCPKIKNVVEGKGSKTITVNVEGAGTYYIAVNTDFDNGAEIEDLYVELLDGEGNGLGDRLAKSNINVKRAHVLPLGALSTGVYAAQGGYFVKLEAAGTGDGSSWDNAADYVAFYNKLDNDMREGKASGNPVTMVVYMAGGTYDVNKQLNVSPADNVKIYGGYPENASGFSLSGRDIEKNATILTHTKYKNESNDDHRIWNLTAGTWLVDGFTFTNIYGGAITLKNAIKFECVNCNIKGNSAVTHSAGVSFATLNKNSQVSFSNCIFEDNTVPSGTGYGAAVGSSGTLVSVATVEFNKCTFRNNSAKLGGGALWARTATYRLTDCSLIDNDVTTNDTDAKKYGGEAILVERNNGVAVYCDRCYISSSVGNQPLIWLGNIDKPATESNASFYMNNSVVAGNWGISNSQIKNVSVGNVVISSSTLSGQNSVGIIENFGTGSVKVINSFVVNTLASGNGTAFVNSGEGTVDVNYSLYSVYSGTTVTLNNSLGDIYLKKDVGNFPTTGSLWYERSAADMKKDNCTSSTVVDDCRGKVHYYAWDGKYPTINDQTFTPSTISNVTSLITTANEGFAAWLTVNGSLSKDIRGVERQDPIWPGSYQN